MAAQQVHKRLAALCRSGVFLDKPVSLIAMEKFPPAITPPVSRTHRLSQERVAQRQLAHPFQRTGKRVGLEPVRSISLSFSLFAIYLYLFIFNISLIY